MALAVFKDLCLDAVDGDLVGVFWASALGSQLDRRDESVAVVRHPLLHSLWINTVPEPKVVKNRVHLDLYAPSVQPLLALGATISADQGNFVVLRDPGGNEMCVFPGDAGAAPARPFALCVDSATPVEAAQWWHRVLGGRIVEGPDGAPRYIEHVDGLAALVLKFVPVDDARVVKNRCHWDVDTRHISELVAAGATVVHAGGDEIGWTVLADPDGNEFCAFAPD